MANLQPILSGHNYMQLHTHETSDAGVGVQRRLAISEAQPQLFLLHLLSALSAGSGRKCGKPALWTVLV